MKIIKIEAEKYKICTVEKITVSNKKQYIRITLQIYHNVFYFPLNSRDQVSKYLHKQLTTAYKEYIT